MGITAFQSLDNLLLQGGFPDQFQPSKEQSFSCGEANTNTRVMIEKDVSGKVIRVRVFAIGTREIENASGKKICRIKYRTPELVLTRENESWVLALSQDRPSLR